MLLSVTFLLLVTFINYFLLLRRARVKGSIHCATGELERVQVDFCLFFLLLRGRGVEVNVFFSQIYEKVEGRGGKGVHLGFSGNVFFIVERLGRGRG